MDREKLQRVLILLCGLLAQGASAQVYQWTDEHGRVRFGDRPPVDATTEQLHFDAGTPRSEPGVEVRFELEEFNLSPEARDRIDRTLPRIINTYKQLFRLDMRKPTVVRLSLLKDSASMTRWIQQRHPDFAPAPLLGIFLVKSREVGVWNHGNEDAVVRTILHEASHVIVAQLSPFAPSWLQEGLAEYFQESTLTDSGLRVSPSAHNLRQIRGWVESGELITLRRYLGIDERSWRAMAHSDNAIPYTVAWGMTYFLLSHEQGKSTLRRVLQDMEKIQRWPTLEDMDHYYPGGLTGMDFRFFKWAQESVAPHDYTLP